MGILSSVLDILFPRKCIFCAKILNKTDEGLCDNCIESLPYADNNGRQDGEIFDFCVSPLYYTDNVRSSILRYKFSGASLYAEYYGEFLADCIRESTDIEHDIISWVPLSAKRERKRGYDQAKLLAEQTALLLNESIEPVLIKHRDVKAQSELGDKSERSSNISGAYSVINPEYIKDKRILLIDDVVTTTSTLEECTRTLLSAGAGSVICAALARGE
ncbi:MAG: double zinc ribbon domain-containing protein [Oscillospiraceae bacterium]|nr:double zinc ribbon domain-containing protein [Oscillospiraceae bacterium]